MRRLSCHATSLSWLALTIALAWPAQVRGVQAGQTTFRSQFTVFSRGQAVGTESVTVSGSAEGWLISSIGGLGAPFDLTTTKFQLRYGPDWQPASLSVEGTQGGQLLIINSTFTSGEARNDTLQRGQRETVTHQISPRAVVLPSGFYGPYEALAAQLGAAAIGATFRVYVAPQAEVGATLTRITPHHLVTSTGAIDLRQFDLTFTNTRTPLSIEVWIDGDNRLARLSIPASWLIVIRDDISSVMTREVNITRAGDEEVFVPALGFKLSGTLSKPAAAGRGPAVVLVGGAGSEDRDQRVSGIPIFGQLAGALADRGYLVIRYDTRGVGRSSGRVESATLEDYADDALSAVEWLKKRPDVDPDRVAIVGYGEGGAIALVAGSRQKRLGGLCLIAAPGQTGRDVTIHQQQHALERSSEPDPSKRAKSDLELRVLDAVIKGTGWDGVPPAVQHQADTAWFRTWLLFDPAKVMKKVNQPLLIVAGELDRQFPPAQADRLETLARARKKLPPQATRKVIVPGINHLLVPATSGEEDEYPALASSTVSPAVTSAIADWLSTTLRKRK
jgi:pimeloyl-ACP methyl ester carboxylesterase